MNFESALSGPSEQGSGPRKPPRSSEQGVALLLVLVCLAIIAPFTAAFNFQTRVDWQSAVNAGDEVRARQAQRGALALSLLLFELQRMVFNQKQFRDFAGTVDITQVAPYLMSVFGTSDGAEGLGDLVGLDTSALSELSIGANVGFETRIEAESGRINVNCIAQSQNGNDTPRSRAVETLEAMMEPIIFDPLFDEEKSDGERYDRQTVLTALVDWIDEDNQRFDIGRLVQGGGNEPYKYEELHDNYQARNARIDSIEELHLVEGIDDDWMQAFQHNLSIYGDCKVNLNFASPAMLAWVIRATVSAEDKWKTEGDNYLLLTMPLANFVAANREWNLFKDLQTFDDMVSKPEDYVAPTLFADDETEQDQSLLPKVPTGIDIRTDGGSNQETGDTWKGIKDVASIDPERVYRVEITTQVGAVRKRVTAVYDMQYARSASSGKGAWLFFREE